MAFLDCKNLGKKYMYRKKKAETGERHSFQVKYPLYCASK